MVEVVVVIEMVENGLVVEVMVVGEVENSMV